MGRRWPSASKARAGTGNLIQGKFAARHAARAPIAQGIEHWPPEPGAKVRILLGALQRSSRFSEGCLHICLWHSDPCAGCWPCWVWLGGRRAALCWLGLACGGCCRRLGAVRGCCRCGGRPRVARRALSSCRASQACRMRWLRATSSVMVNSMRGARPMRRAWLPSEAELWRATYGRRRSPSVAVRAKPTVPRTAPGPRFPSAMCPWTPQHAHLQRDKVTHDGTEKDAPPAREFADHIDRETAGNHQSPCSTIRTPRRRWFAWCPACQRPLGNFSVAASTAGGTTRGIGTPGISSDQRKCHPRGFQ